MLVARTPCLSHADEHLEHLGDSEGGGGARAEGVDLASSSQDRAGT